MTATMTIKAVSEKWSANNNHQPIDNNQQTMTMTNDRNDSDNKYIM